MILADKYLFFIEIPGSGKQQVWPINDSLEWKWEREKDEICLYRENLNTKLVFINNGHATFDALYTIEKDKSTCKEIKIEIAKRCKGEVDFQKHWDGLISLVDGDWNISKCKYEVKPRSNDSLSCLFRNWSKTKNLFDIPNRHVVSALYGGLQGFSCENEIIVHQNPEDFLTCKATYEYPECAPPDVGWVKVKQVITRIFNANDPCGFPHVETTYARELTYADPGPPPGNGWIDLGVLHQWARPAPVSAPTTTQESENTAYETILTITTVWQVAQLQANNGLLMSDVLYYLLSDCDYTIKSDFFGINADGTAPSNGAYQYASDYLQNLMVLQNADVVIATATQDSFISNNNFKDFWADIKQMFNLCLIIEEDNTLRLEHISYVSGQRILDLTQDALVACLEGLWSYSYDKEKRPQKETFKWNLDSDGSSDWDGAYFEYPDLCSNDNEDTKETEITIKGISTNVAYFYNNEDADRENEGVFLVSTFSAGTNFNLIHFTLGPISGAYQLNNPLSWANLIESLHIYRKPVAFGIMNGKDTIFQTIKRTKEQPEITVPMCCTDIREFDPVDLIRTQLGLGELVSATYKDPGEVLKLNILHN